YPFASLPATLHLWEDNTMQLARRSLVPASLIAICAFTGLAARADDGSDPPNRYMVNRLTSDLPGVAQNTDSVLQNAWGVAFTPGASPFWVADNATGCSTLYDGTGLPQPQPTPLRVKIPLPGNVVPDTACQMVDPKNPPTNAAPTGIVWNPTTAFLVPNTTPPRPGHLHLRYRGRNDFGLDRRSERCCRGRQ